LRPEEHTGLVDQGVDDLDDLFVLSVKYLDADAEFVFPHYFFHFQDCGRPLEEVITGDATRFANSLSHLHGADTRK
jgi:hypothetical protein